MSKLFKFKLLLSVFMISLVTTLAIPFYSYATEIDSESEINPLGAGQWDFKGQESDKILGAGVPYLTSEYTATDGGNFKIDMQSTYISSNFAHVTYYINGVQKYTLLSSIDSHKGTAEINNIPAGAKVKFFITVDKSDTFTFKFYD